MQPSSPLLRADGGALRNPEAVPAHQPFSNRHQGKGGCRAVVLQLPGIFRQPLRNMSSTAQLAYVFLMLYKWI